MKILHKVNLLPFAILWFITLTVLLCTPGKDLPQETWLDNIPLFDKWIHIALFGGLVFLWCGTFSQKRKKYFISVQQLFVRIALCGCVYGIAMEFVQKYFVPNRSFEIGDIIADTIGSIAGFMVATKTFSKK